MGKNLKLQGTLYTPELPVGYRGAGWERSTDRTRRVPGHLQQAARREGTQARQQPHVHRQEGNQNLTYLCPVF